VLSVLPTVAWLMGDSAGCEAAIAQGLAHVERLARPFDEAMFHAWVAGTRYTQRRYSLAAQHAMRAIEISTPRGFREWLATGGLLALLAQVAVQASAPAVEQLRQLCAAFAAQRIGLNASYYGCGLARGLMRLQDWAGAETVLAFSQATAQSSGETRMNADMLLLQAQLPARHDEAAALRREALRVAESQGALATALRAAAELLLNDAPGDAAARACAQRALARLEGQPAPADDAESGWMERHHAELTQWLARRTG
jgi:hypothetical protein